jgi:hypothetical protein
MYDVGYIICKYQITQINIKIIFRMRECSPIDPPARDGLSQNSHETGTTNIKTKADLMK